MPYYRQFSSCLVTIIYLHKTFEIKANQDSSLVLHILKILTPNSVRFKPPNSVRFKPNNWYLIRCLRQLLIGEQWLSLRKRGAHASGRSWTWLHHSKIIEKRNEIVTETKKGPFHFKIMLGLAMSEWNEFSYKLIILYTDYRVN